MKNKKIFVTFGDGTHNLRKAALRLSNQAKNLKIFDEIIIGNLNFLKRNCFKEYQHNKKFIIENSRGMGYWIWKPILINWVLNNCHKNSIIFYADAGCEFLAEGSESLRYYIKQVSKKNSLFFKLPYNEAQWSKMDLIKHRMIKLKNPENLNQIQATYFFLKNNKKIKELISKWYFIAFENNYSYLDDSKSKMKNSIYFKEHRHDQSILSCLVHKKKLNIDGYAYYFHPRLVSFSNSPMRKLFIHSFRNKTPISVLKKYKSVDYTCKVYLHIYFFIKKIYFKFNVFAVKYKLLRIILNK